MYTKNQIISATRVLKNNKTNYWTGNECINFENEFSRYIRKKYSVAVANGSVALEIAIKSLNLKSNDQIIVTPRSFVISASCVLNLNLSPIFADVDDNGNLNIETIRNAYNNNVKAIILVHLNGLPCDMSPILKFAKKKKIFLIEDCSQAHGAFYKKKPVGSFGDVSTWSFCQDKIISTGGEGGMISTNNRKIWNKCWSIKEHGKSYKKSFSKKKYTFNWLHENLGSNYRMTEMQAAIGRCQLKNLNIQVQKRNQIANMYIQNLNMYFGKNALFKKIDFRCNTCPLRRNKIIKKCNLCRHAFYRFNIFLNSRKFKRDKLIKTLNNNNISCGSGSCPEIYLEKIFKKMKFFPKKRLINAKLLGETSLMFPINPNKSKILIKKEISKIKNILKIYL